MFNVIITYSEIKPIFEKRCNMCHNWLNYDVAFNKRQRIKEKVYILRDMPVGGNITEYERYLIKKWVDDGGQK